MPELNVLALYKGDQKFLFVYDDHSHPELLAAIRDQAADPALALNWFDAATLISRLEPQPEVEPLTEPPAPRL